MKEFIMRFDEKENDVDVVEDKYRKEWIDGNGISML